MSLEIYKKALRDYQLSRFIPFGRFIFDTKFGFCWYFQEKHSVHIEDLEELCKYKPKDTITYWFKSGHLKPRINILKQIIYNYIVWAK